MNRRSFLGGGAALALAACAPAPDAVVAPHILGGQAGDLALSEAPTRVTADGTRVALDRVEHLLVRTSPSGEVRSIAGGQGFEIGELNGPSHLAVLSDGDVWVLDRGNGRLQRFDADGEVVDVLDDPDASALDVMADDTLIIARAARQEVALVSPSGAERVVDVGMAPVDVAPGASGAVLVLGRREVLEIRGGAVRTVVREGLVWAAGVACTADGRIHVADAGTNALLVLDGSGRELERIALRLADGRPAQPIGLYASFDRLDVRVVPAAL
ncbi:MAG: hypothetical protein KC656_09030 [Myxococcales bacterium]|nr:hypothetical protein [Myxococcales bacterium]